MALSAAVAKFSVVHIAMTRRATAKFDVHKFSEEELVASLHFIFGNRLLGMTFLTSDHLMFAGQSKLGLIVGKFLRRFPTSVRMTFQTILRKLAAMFVFVTAQAFRIQSQKCLAEIDFRIDHSWIVHNFVRLMTTLAGLLRVLAFQSITGLSVVEISFAARPENHVEVFSIVFAVAFKTCFAIFAGNSKMIAFSICQPLRNFTMAVQTFLHIRAAAERVAFGAIGHPLQIGVGLRQFAGRNLCPCRGC